MSTRSFESWSREGWSDNGRSQVSFLVSRTPAIESLWKTFNASDLWMLCCRTVNAVNWDDFVQWHCGLRGTCTQLAPWVAKCWMSGQCCSEATWPWSGRSESQGASSALRRAGPALYSDGFGKGQLHMGQVIDSGSPEFQFVTLRLCVTLFPSIQGISRPANDWSIASSSSQQASKPRTGARRVHRPVVFPWALFLPP